MPPRSQASESLGIEAVLWDAANKMRGNMDPSEYKHVALGLIFLKHVSDAFRQRREALELSITDPSSEEFIPDVEDRAQVLENRDEYISEGVFWVPSEARWDGADGIQASAKQPGIGTRIDAAMDAIERENTSLRGVLPKNYARAELDPVRLGGLVDIISNVGLLGSDNENDLLGRVYEYFLGQFAASEGKGGGEYYTPRSVVELLVEMLEPLSGRVYDPACGSGGMFVQAEKFVTAHGGSRDNISVYGQESNATTWRIAKMNLALRGIEANLGPEWGDTFHDDKHPDLRADYVMANPPFNISDWGGERLREDHRWSYGMPPAGNANYAWIQHIVSKLAPNGTAGIVLANGSMSSNINGEGDIRRALVEADLVECMVALPPQLFYSTGIPVCLWFLNRNKAGSARRGSRDRREHTLFIDARRLGSMVSRVHRELLTEDINAIASAYHNWQGGPDRDEYKDRPGLCVSVGLDRIREEGYSLSPGRYVAASSSAPTDALQEFDAFTSALDVLQDAVRAAQEAEQAALDGLDGISPS